MPMKKTKYLVLQGFSYQMRFAPGKTDNYINVEAGMELDSLPEHVSVADLVNSGHLSEVVNDG